MTENDADDLILLTRTRELWGIDQVQVGEVLGLSRQMVSMIEHGRRNLRFEDKMMLLTMDAWVDASNPPQPETVEMVQQSGAQKATQWLQAEKAMAEQALPAKEKALLTITQAYERSKTIVCQLQGPAPAGALKPLPQRWKQRIIKHHQRIMERNSPLVQMRLRAEMARLRAVLEMEES